MDPGFLATNGEGAAELELVVPYSDPETTAAALASAAKLTAGLNAHILLLAVHTLPYPVPFVCPSLVHAHLVEQLLDLAAGCSLPVQPQVVLARERLEGFKYAIQPGSTVLVATHRHIWRTPDEKLARALAGAGHKVVLVHVA